MCGQFLRIASAVTARAVERDDILFEPMEEKCVSVAENRKETSLCMLPAMGI